MKSIYFQLFSWIIMMISASSTFGQTQAPNSGFETWSGSLPVNWNTISQVSHVSQATPSHSGSYGVRLDTKNVILYGAIPGLLTLGTFNSSTNNVEGGIAFSERPDSLVVWYKYFPQTGDTGFIAMGTFLNADTIAKVSVPLTTIQSTWKRLSIPLTYMSPANPTIMNIGFLSSNKSCAKVGTYLIVDDVQLIYNWTFVCNTPTALTATNITTNSASLNWASTGTENSWNIQYGPTGFTPGSGTTVTVINKPYSLTGLIDDTNYSYYVKASCSNGLISDWAGPYDFKTLSSCFAPTNLNASAITMNAALLNWTIGNSESQWILEWGTSGFVQGSGTTINLTAKPYALTGLTESTAYSYYVKADCGNGKQSNWSGPFNFSSLSSCPPPTALIATNVGTNTATLSWSAGGSESQWVMEWGITGFSPGTGVSQNISSLPYVLNMLTNGSQYHFYVKADCGGGKQSTWAGPFTFTTNSVSCDISISNFPWNESFEDGMIPNCWTQVYENGTVSWMVGTGNNTIHPDNAQNGTKNALIKITNPLNKNKVTKLITPPLNLTNLSNIQLSFWHVQQAWSTDQDELQVYYKTSQNGAWELLNSYTAEVNDWTEHIISLPNKSAQYYIAFESKLKYGYGIGIDNITVSGTPVTCTVPSNLVAASITENSADLSWTETGTATQWTLEWGNSGFTQGAGTLANLSGTSYSLSGLLPNTSYQFYVKSNCDSESSAYSGPFGFTSAQNPCVVSAFPWTEGFEGGVLPGCWTESLVLGTNHWQFLKGNGASNPSLSHTGIKNAVLKRTTTGVDSTRIITPQFDLSHLENPVLKFWHTQAVWGSDQDQLRIYYKTSATGSWNLLSTYISSVTSWTERTINLPNKSAAYTIAFAGTAKYGYGVCIDDISINGTIVNCVAPSNLAVSAITETAATLAWTENAASTSWDVEYGVQGFTQGSGIAINNTTNPISISGLNTNTNYSFYVRSVCDATNKSAWVGPFNFHTTCGAAISVFPWNEGFEGGVIPPCWSEQLVSGIVTWEYANGGYNVGGASGSPSAAHTGSFNARFKNIDNTATDVSQLISPALNLSIIASPVLKFWRTQANWSGDQDQLKVYYKTSATGAWTILATYTTSTTTWTEMTINLPNPSANYYIAFEGKALYGHGVCIDDVSVSGTPILSSEKEILSFSILQQIGSATINTTNATISLTVPFGTNVTGLIPTITVSPNATINPASQVALDFTNPVIYNVTAQNLSTKAWTIQVNIAPYVSSEAEIITFTHPQQTSSATINSTNATVELDVANGAGITALTPIATVSAGATIVPVNGAAVNFTITQIYTVTAADSTKKDWNISVTEAPLYSSAAEILTFSFTQETAPAIINSQTATISVEVTSQTSLASLTPAITISTGATVNSAVGTTLNFTSPVQYTVTAENGTTQKVWTVNVTRVPFNAAEITSFSFVEQTGAATINSTNATVNITVINNADLTSLTPTIVLSQGATISPLSNVAQDFSSAFTYTVTAENTITTKLWTVNVTKAAPTADVIVEWNFPNSPDDSIADGGIVQNLTSILNKYSAGAKTFTDAGASTFCIKSLGWDNGSGIKCWETEFSTESYRDITVSSKQNSTLRGPKNFKLQYKLGSSGTWIDVPAGTITVANNWTGGVVNNLVLPAECSNQSSLFLKWIMTSNTSVTFLSVTADAGSSIDDIIVKGMYDITLDVAKINLSDVSVFPNPFTNILNIEFENLMHRGMIEIINAEGKMINRIHTNNSTSVQVNTSTFSNGFYIVKIITAEGVKTVKVVK